MSDETVISIAPGWHGRIAAHLPGDPSRIAEDLSTLLMSVTPPHDHDVLHRGRNLLYRGQLAGHEVVIKRFRCRGLYQGLLYRWRSSKAQRSFAHAQALLTAGFSTPLPWLFAERRRGRKLVDSVYISSWQGGCHEIRALIGDIHHPERNGHLYRIGDMIGRLHEAGILHRDLTPGNVLISGADQRWCYDLVDLNRMGFGPVDPGRGLRNLVGIDPGDTPGRLALIAGYCQPRTIPHRLAIHQFWTLARRNALRLRCKRRSRRWRHGISKG